MPFVTYDDLRLYLLTESEGCLKSSLVFIWHMDIAKCNDIIAISKQQFLLFDVDNTLIDVWHYCSCNIEPVEVQEDSYFVLATDIGNLALPFFYVLPHHC